MFGFSPVMMGKVIGPPATIAFGGSTVSSADSSSYSLSVGIGTASADRYVVVAVTAQFNSATDVTSVTVAGQPCTRLVSQISPSGKTWVSLYITNTRVTSGTSATVAIEINGTSYNIGIAAYAVTLSSRVPTAVASNAGAVAGLTIPIKKEGIVVAVASVQNNTPMSWTGITRYYDANVEGSGWRRHSGGGDAFEDATSLTIGVTNLNPTSAIVAAAFR